MAYIWTFTILLLGVFHFSFDESLYQESFIKDQDLELSSEALGASHEIVYKKPLIREPAKIVVKKVKAPSKELSTYHFELIKAENIAKKISLSKEELSGSVEISGNHFATDGFNLDGQDYAKANVKISSGKVVTLNIDGNDIKVMISHDKEKCTLFLPSGWRLTFSS